MGRYWNRYRKRYYVSRLIRRDLYEELIQWCGGDTINFCLEKVLKFLKNCRKCVEL